MKKRQILALGLAACMVAGMAAGCGSSTKEPAEQEGTAA